MNIWLVGYSGILGSSIYSLLQSKKINVSGTRSTDIDITSLSDIRRYVKKKDFTHIINCSGYTDVDTAEENKKKAYGINAYGVKNLAEVSLEIGAKVMHFSSDYVFSGNKNEPYVEEDLPDPETIYGKSKLLGEKFLLSIAKDPCLIRTSWLFGFAGKNFVQKIIDLLQEKEEIFIVSDQIGSPTFSDDLAGASLDLLSFSGIFHFANDNSLSRYEFAKMILNYARKFYKIKCKKIIPVSTKKYGAKAKRPLYSVLSTKKIEDVLQKKVPSFEKALNLYISFYKKNICKDKNYA